MRRCLLCGWAQVTGLTLWFQVCVRYMINSFFVSFFSVSLFSDDIQVLLELQSVKPS